MPLNLASYSTVTHRNKLHKYLISDESDIILLSFVEVDNYAITRLYVKHLDGSKTNGVNISLSRTNNLITGGRDSIVLGEVTDNSNFLIPSLNKYIIIEGVKDRNPVEIQVLSTLDCDVYDSNVSENYGSQYGIYNAYEIPRHPWYPNNYSNSYYEVEDTLVVQEETYLYDWTIENTTPEIKISIDTDKLSSTTDSYIIPIIFEVSLSLNNALTYHLIGTPKVNFIPKIRYEYSVRVKYPPYGINWPG